MNSSFPFRLIARLIIMDSFGFIMTSLLSLKLGLVEASCSMQVSCFFGAGTHFFSDVRVLLCGFLAQKIYRSEVRRFPCGSRLI